MNLTELANTGLTDSDLGMIVQAAQSIAEIEQLILFGSRAKGNFKPGSDVDLVVKGKMNGDDAAISLADLLNEERPLPYFFDVLTYRRIQEPRLLEHIERVGIVLFDRNLCSGY